MDFTLRQARKLEAGLRNLVVENQIVSVRAYDQDVARDDVDKLVKDLSEEISDKIELNEIRHTIKLLINVKNMECGITELLNTRDSLHTRRDLLNTIGDSDDLERQIEYIRVNPSASRMVNMVTEEIADRIDDELLDIDADLDYISKKLNDLNSTIIITLGDGEVTFLQERGFT